MRYLVASLLLFITYLLSPMSVLAVTTPSFPSCLNPQGSLKASYANGVHGIAGSSNTYTGQDTVYQINDSQVLQCFCDNTGAGIQTNWLKVSQLSDNDIQILENDGWILIPNGALWGLDPVAYLAKNVPFSCQGSNSGGGSSNGTSATNNPINAATQGVLAAATFAGTGNTAVTISFLSIGITSLALAIYLKKMGL